MRIYQMGVKWSVRFVIGLLAVSGSFAGTDNPEASSSAQSPYARWKNGPSAREDYFPIGVWLQNPQNASKYQQAGFNLYVGLWQGPTEKQLTLLRNQNMPVICQQNEYALQNLDDPIIVGWLQQDEPDNAQPMKDPVTGRNTYGPPVQPRKVIERYQTLQQRDPTRPIFLNLGQGVANDEWVGRGAGFDPNTYTDYAKGCDILSFDVYPVAGLNKTDSENYLWYIPKGVDRMREWSRGERILWNFVECTHIDNPDKKATPEQVKAEVWMSLIHGSQGILYFVHDFKPKVNEAALLSDPEMLEGVTQINRRIQELAPVLNSPTRENEVKVESTNPEVPVDCLVKAYRDDLYLFAVGMRNQETTAKFTLPSAMQKCQVEEMQEKKTFSVENGTFEAHFAPYEVKMYRIKSDNKQKTE